MDLITDLRSSGFTRPLESTGSIEDSILKYTPEIIYNWWDNGYTTKKLYYYEITFLPDSSQEIEKEKQKSNYERRRPWQQRGKSGGDLTNYLLNCTN